MLTIRFLPRISLVHRMKIAALPCPIKVPGPVRSLLKREAHCKNRSLTAHVRYILILYAANARARAIARAAAGT